MTKIVIQVLALPELKAFLKKFPTKAQIALAAGIRWSATLAQRVEKQEAPIDQGYLRQSIDVRYRFGGLEAVIWPRANYANLVHEGTGLYGPEHHRIYPTRAKVLAWKSKDGQMIFRRSTAGQKPNRFANRTVGLIRVPVHEHFDRVVDNLIKGR